MNEKLLWWANVLRKKGYYEYVLHNYIDRDYWMKKLKTIFPDNYIENITDFNYSTCFELCIYISPVNSSFTSTEFKEYLAKHSLVYGMRVEISAIAPYFLCRYEKRSFTSSGSNSLEWKFTPYESDHFRYAEKIEMFLKQERLTELDEHLINIEIPNIHLELRDSHVKIYHCLFQDEY